MTIKSLQDLINGFGAVVVSYHQTASGEVVADDVNVAGYVSNHESLSKNLSLIETHKSSASRFDSIKLINNLVEFLIQLDKTGHPKEAESRAAIENDVLQVIMKFHDLNHGKASTVTTSLSAVPYELTSTKVSYLTQGTRVVSYVGSFFWGGEKFTDLSKFGQSLRDHLLRPIGASKKVEDDREAVQSEVKAIIHKIFEDVARRHPVVMPDMELEAKLAALPATTPPTSALAVSTEEAATGPLAKEKVEEKQLGADEPTDLPEPPARGGLFGGLH